MRGFVGPVVALLRAGWIAASSYRLRLVFSALGAFVSIIPLYYITTALQERMADVVASEAPQYFAYVLVGQVTVFIAGAALNSMHERVAVGLGNGSFEALLSTPTRVGALLAGMGSYDLSWALLKSFVVIVSGAIMGATLVWSRFPAAALLMALIILAHVGIGLAATASVIAFRTATPLPTLLLLASSFLSGVYYPVSVIPTWIQYASYLLPMTYGLRALRRVAVSGTPFGAVASDVGILVVFTVVLLAVGWRLLTLALHHAKKSGSLTQY